MKPYSIQCMFVWVKPLEMVCASMFNCVFGFKVIWFTIVLDTAFVHLEVHDIMSSCPLYIAFVILMYLFFEW